MMRAVLRALWLELRRDRGALVMAFVLPVAFFMVFAFIFTGGGGGTPRIRLALADTVQDEDSKALVDALLADTSIERVGEAGEGPQRVHERVRSGGADVGLVVQHALRDREAGAPPPLRLLFDPTREVAAAMLGGRVQQAYVEALPDVALGQVLEALDARFLDLSAAQRARLATGLEGLRGAGGAESFGSLTSREAVAGRKDGVNHVAYYAGAVAVLFLLFSAVHGATTLLEERDAGILDRILAGPAGMPVLVRARFLFVALQGFAQVLVIYLVAWLGYGVDLPGNLVGFTLTTGAVSLAAAGLSLTLVAACSSRRQAQNLSTVVILILSAVGGSMVPRFFMPPLLQDLGWLTPNTWALEAYTSVFWRGDPLSALLLPLVLLAGAGLVGLFVAERLARRWEVL